MDLEYKLWLIKYHKKKILNLRSKLTEKEILVLEKLGFHIEDKKYTESEFDSIDNELWLYWVNEKSNESDNIKKLPKGISREEYNELTDKFYQIAATNF